MLIARPVTVKSKVTPNLRAQLVVETQKALRDVEREMERPSAAKTERDRQELLARKDSLVKQLKDLAELRDGQEIQRGQVQGYYELRVGDTWPEVLSCEVVVEDGRVVAIREGKVVSVALPVEGKP